MVKVLKKREQLLLYIILALACFSLFFNFIAYPLWQKNRALSNEIARTKLRLIKYLEILNRKDELEKNHSDASPTLLAFEQKQDTVVSVLAELEHLSKKTNVKILDIRPQSTTRSSKKQAVAFDLRLEGDIEGYLKFIYEIENSVFLLQIKKILLRAKANSPLIEVAFTIIQISRG
jgi:hypothetical protein